ncbi:hypothetical protein [Hymenobacter metallilatus]|uniref:Uncharacterized protein n=1 Tax=Hymenobacter metallilatus TaxID=2493666 RepID=A0A428JTJ8_9BACT|nr:hypothetical protein [Hymenobacter metallilatus]RSK37457.1 hypothetical protein EI290_02060 [Hymenobacter metallilatus]
MMRPELERLHHIERHLLGAAPAPEWPLLQLLDADLEADTELQRQLYQGVYRAGQQQLRQELHQIHQRLYRRRGWLQAGTNYLHQLRRLWRRA